MSQVKWKTAIFAIAAISIIGLLKAITKYKSQIEELKLGY